VNSSSVQDQFSNGIWFDSGEPVIVLGRILAREYGSSITAPLPERMTDLLSQLDEGRETSSAVASPSDAPLLAGPRSDL
jgi:hypothetical protein